MKKKIVLVKWEAGGSHLQVCLNIKEALLDRHPDWEIRIADMVSDLAPKIDPFEKKFGFSNADIYNYLLRKNFVFLIYLQFVLGRMLIKMIQKQIIASTKTYLLTEKPDLVISAVHHFNDLLAQASAECGIPFGVVPTEVEDIENRPLWFSPLACRKASFFALATQTMVQQGQRLGAHSNCICTGGLAINKKFYDTSLQSQTKEAVRTQLGLDTEAPTILVANSSVGGQTIIRIMRELEKTEHRLQIIAVCGRNQQMKTTLDTSSASSKHRIHVLGFTQDIHLYLKAADLVISKPGPTFTWEAIALKTPIIYDAHRVIIWEKAQERLVVQNNLGLSIKKRSDLPKTIDHLMGNGKAELLKLRLSRENFRTANALDTIVAQIDQTLGLSNAPR